jgi:hypothetical protein
MPEHPWYDRLLVVFPEVYRAGVFILGIVVLGVFLLVRLGFNFDWDTTLTSYYFGFPCSVVFIISGIVFLVRRFNLWHKHSFLDAGFILSGIALGWLAAGITRAISTKETISSRRMFGWRMTLRNRS